MQSHRTRVALLALATALLPWGAAYGQEESGAERPSTKASASSNAMQALQGDVLGLGGGSEGTGSASASSDLPIPRGRKDASDEEKKTRMPTEITASKETSFDEKTRKVVFIGDVVVKDPEFHLSCERLTAFLKRSDSNTAAPGVEDGGGLEKAIAEGKVVIVQEKPDEKGKITRYVGKAAKVEYNAITGDVVLSGWPQIQQGINNQVATEEGTVMILNKNGRLKTLGGSKTVIAESTEAPKKGASRSSRKPGLDMSRNGGTNSGNSIFLR